MSTTPGGEKIRTVQFRGAGVVAPSSLWFNEKGRILVTPGCYEFEPGRMTDQTDDSPYGKIS